MGLSIWALCHLFWLIREQCSACFLDLELIPNLWFPATFTGPSSVSTSQGPHRVGRGRQEEFYPVGLQALHSHFDQRSSESNLWSLWRGSAYSVIWNKGPTAKSINKADSYCATELCLKDKWHLDTHTFLCLKYFKREGERESQNITRD